MCETMNKLRGLERSILIHHKLCTSVGGLLYLLLAIGYPFNISCVLSSIINYKFLEGRSHTVPPCIPKATTQQSALINNEGSLTLIVYFLYILDSLGPDESTVEAKIKTLHIY